MKLKPMAHQETAKALQWNREYYALFGEQGTGKTYMILDDVESLHWNGDVDGFIVISPKGVHTNWINREMPKHWNFDYNAVAYKPKVKYVTNAFAEMMASSKLAVFTINFEAAVTKQGYEMLLEFLRTKKKVYMVIDESHRIKNPNSKRTKMILALAPLAAFRRIATGTATPNSPPDMFSQAEFLAPGQGILGTRSYRSFVATYTKLHPQNSPLVQHIKSQSKRRINPQIPVQDSEGNPIYMNLDKLEKIVSEFSYRVLKKDCLDLPEKIPKLRDYELPPWQRKYYDQVKDELLIELEGCDDPETFDGVAAGRKLQQINSGFILIDGNPRILNEKENPRIDLMAGIVEDYEGQFIIWAQYIWEFELIRRQLEKMNISAGFYYGDVKDADREFAVDEFQAGGLRAFVGHPAAGGVGLTLTAAEDVLYFTNGFKWDDREQSEDRCHRIGTVKHVTYTDLLAINTIDERVLSTLKSKGNMSKAIMGELEHG